MTASSLRARVARLPLNAYKRYEISVGIPARRARRARHLGALTPGGITVVTVNWNTLPYLETMVRMVRRHSPAETRIVVVDNGSTDGSRDWIRAEPGIEGVMLPFNIHHGPAADIGALRVRTEFLVLLDVDAFPFSDAWLPEVLDALRAGATVAGGHIHREYVHPSYLAMRTADFVTRKHSFAIVGKWRKGVKGGGAGFRDAGEDISVRERERFGPGATHFVPVTEKRGPGMLGTVFGDLVYHNFFATGYGPASERTEQTTGAWTDAVARWVDVGGD
jgi:glycosyltransferase involved in cell wall biosynthesis